MCLCRLTCDLRGQFLLHPTGRLRYPGVGRVHASRVTACEFSVSPAHVTAESVAPVVLHSFEVIYPCCTEEEVEAHVCNRS